ncbi:MAG: ATP-binding protein [Rhodospirillales bacterium]|nr:ATP-binding protein [Rhodospirillales bacterium]
MRKIDVPANPGRLIHAVANIGYDPEVALCDLMDNSIDANASRIEVSLQRDVHESDGQSDSISSYVIADDGIGMDEDTLVNAFTLGTKRDYPSGSLGKFGLGLKSAGLSLGDEIVILTESADSSPICARFSITDIERTGEYQIDLGDIPEDYSDVWTRYHADGPGTVLIVRELNEGQPSYSQFSEYLGRYCSTIFHRFLERKNPPLAITINGTSLSPFDPLFYAEASDNGPMGDPRDWDGKTVHLLLEDSLTLGESAEASIAATHLIHPPSFGRDERRVAQEQYAINPDPFTRKPRHGFYVYRNDRIIVLAERFWGLVGNQTQNWAFRARLMFSETADDLLSIDVKKGHCKLPGRSRNTLKAMIARYQTKSVDAWKEAGERQQAELASTKDDVANESISSSPASSLDYSPGSDVSDPVAANARQERMEEISTETIGNIQDPAVDLSAISEKAEGGDVVVPVEGLKANAMWLPYPAISLGRAETILNTQHSWVAQAYSMADNDPKVTLVLHHLFTILARAELEVRSTPWNDVSGDVIDKVLSRFRRKVSAIGEDLAEALDSAASDLEIDSDE